MSRINVDKITGATGTASGAPITLSGDTATLGSGATYNGTIGTSATGFGLITHMDQWRLTASTGGGSGVLTSNLERVDTDWSGIGTGMTESSGIFTFPVTGIWLVNVDASFYSASGAANYQGIYTQLDDDGTGFSNRAVNLCNVTGTSYYSAMSTSIALDIENTSTHSVRFYMASSGNSDMRAIGDTNANQTGFTFIRLADT